MAKKKITRIKAGESGSSKENPPKTPVKAPESAKTEKSRKDTAKDKNILKTAKKAEKRENGKKLPAPIRIITAPFRVIGRYIRDSWLELRQVRWPSRAATWKMLIAVVVYSGLLIAIIMLLDALFTWLFNLILG